ncbi:MAG: FAA hydrolase family protein [Phycisphaerales bacterium]|nr:MAG: FAA hydrolase family protein [Phycisphaerales bacterium]
MRFIRHEGLFAIERVAGAPLVIPHVLAIGRNYAEHAKEMGGAPPERPVVFTKNPASLCFGAALGTHDGDIPEGGDDIVIPKVCQDRPQVDYEGELCIVIGERCKDVPEAAALSVVMGCCVANDVSARWWQKEGSGGQFHRGKSFDTFCPVGPHITPMRDIPDVQSLTLTTTLNGETVQRATTADMLFPVARLISELSMGTTLLPGTLILTGTPEGVGAGRTPQRFLKDGDTVTIKIDPLGAITNKVRAE